MLIMIGHCILKAKRKKFNIYLQVCIMCKVRSVCRVLCTVLVWLCFVPL